MIKTPVFALFKETIIYFHIVDAEDKLVALATSCDNCDQIVSALNAQQPKCKTCGGSGIVKQQEDGGVAELFCDCPIGEEKLEVFLKDNPDCRPIQPAEEEPKCKTCGGLKIVCKDDIGLAFGGVAAPCPDCPPATQTGELVKKLRIIAGNM